jgi:mannose-1-phosphate guanylyltransferase / mannose-6-phosphate isomerase
MTVSIVPVVLAGGSGTRLWPLSRDTMPKQFLPFNGGRSTYQEALLRVRASGFGQPIVVTGAAVRATAKRQADELGVDPVILIEPVGRDSGPAIAAATAMVRHDDRNAIVLCVAADHVVLDEEAFRQTCETSLNAARRGDIVTFGIKPSEPRTSYGYIQPGDVIDNYGVRRVKNFIEKPSAETATRYVQEGFLWNSGNLLFHVDAMAEEIARLAPELAIAAGTAIATARRDNGYSFLDQKSFAAAPRISIDYAVMEKTTRAAVVTADFRWSDIGSWEALSDVIAADDEGNVIRGAGMSVDSKRCIIHADRRLVAAVGVEDLVIAETADAILVTHRNRTQNVRDLVDRLKSAKRPEATVHRRVDRPWGHFETIDGGERFQVKRLTVKPGKSLSLQKHEHRAEHWVVVRGTADVTIEGTAKAVDANQAVYIPIGSAHRLANHGATSLELIEVQTGDYLGEDDIIRLDDPDKRD